MARLGILPLGRPTFDVPFAKELLTAALADLDASGHDIVGPRGLLFDGEATEAALADLKSEALDLVLILQVTFTDAVMTAKIAAALDAPLAIWAFPEPRIGGRLRLNAFCGLNLAAHALGLRGIEFSWLYREPATPGFDEALADMLSGDKRTKPVDTLSADEFAGGRGSEIVSSIRGSKIGRIGAHPDGFDTCAYDDAKLDELAGISVTPIELDSLFATAKASDAAEVAHVREEAETLVSGLDDVNAEELDRSLRLKVALEDIRSNGGFDAFAIRCWPETFTEYGGAVCGPVSMMGEKRIPCACEADVYGALTSLIMQKVADAPAFLVDLVDIDAEDGTGVVWHCGQAPISMAEPDVVAEATIHTNRKMPLLFEFPLKTGRVTLARISQARGETKMVISTGEMLKRPMAFTGTSGVIKFDTAAGEVMDRVMDAGLEHHTALVYGDHSNTLRAVAAELGLPVLEL